MRQPRSTSACVSARPRPRDAPVTIPICMAPPYEGTGRRYQTSLVLGPRVDETGADGGDGCLCAVCDAGLGEHVADVGLDRLLGDVELARDLLVRKAAPDQHQHVAFAWSQVVERFGIAG